MSTPPVARSSAATPGDTRGADSFSDLASLDAEIDALAHDLGRGSGDVRPITSFVASQAAWSPFRIGRYTALERVGSGGMGVVYAAYDHELDRKVAIKIVRRVGDSDSDEATARMRREAQALAKVNHPNVLAVHEVGVHDESSAPNSGADPIAAGRFVFIVTEFVVGKTLREWWSESPRSWTAVRDAIVQAARGLAAAHGVGLVHRDVKPENAMIDAEGRVRLMDFGLARARFDPQDRTLDGSGSGSTTTPAISRDGAMIGTPAYMAPEQLRGEEVGPAADQFALAVMAWEGWFGERPFDGAGMPELMANVLEGRRREPPRAGVVPGAIRRALERALATSPADRWPDVSAFAAALSGGGRRRWWVVALPIVAVSAAVLAVPREPDACADRRAQLGGVWDDDVRERVRAAMLATRVPYAEDTFDRIAPRLDAHADAWMTAFIASCRDATLSDGLKTRQAVCLAQRKRSLGATAKVLSAADATAVERAVEGVDALADVATCTDVAALAAKVEPPTDPGVAAEVDALRDRLGEVEAMLAAGAYKTAAPLATDVVAEARDVAYPPVLAEALLARGRLDIALADYPAAEEKLRESYSTASASGDDATAGDAAVDLVRLVGHRLAKHDAAIEWGFHADGIVRRHGGGAIEARRLENLAEVWFDKGDADKALDHYQRALAIHEAAPEVRADAAIAHDGIGRVYRSRGEYDLAMDHLGRALAIREEALSPNHPAVGGTHVAIASVCLMRIDHDGAREHYTRALEIYEAAFGPEHPNVATALDGIGWVHTQREEPAKALPLHERSLAIREKMLVADHPEIATSLGYLGQAESALRNHARARGYFERALAMAQKIHEGDHPQTASRFVNIADTYAAERDFVKARELYRKGLAMKERTIGRKHPSYAVTLMDLAGTYLETEEYDTALPLTLEAVALLEQTIGAEHPDIGNALRVVGTIHQRRGDHDLAIAAFERALSLLAPSDTMPGVMGDLRFELARSLWEAGTDRTRALELAREAAKLHEEHVPISESLVEIRAWLDDPARRTPNP